MTNKEAATIIEMLFYDSTNEDYPFTEEFGKVCELAIEALMESEKYKRMILLLEKCLELFRKEECPYLINILAETIFYDDVECDGYCLMEEMAMLLEELKGGEIDG